ncbi:hemerythrin domain-containing protein [Streptomyces gamaensis]|uniref:Hemerythrin domain-containing protein n=1 Tax=Streptomyces gamaensis TaxID=1763542 RepID=A0ABW0Z1S4_9ACTN
MPHNTRDADLIGELTADHRKVRRLFDRIRAAPPGSTARKELADQVTAELVRHGAVEEKHLHPALRRHLPRGARWCEQDLADHAAIERVLRELGQQQPGEAEFDHLLVELITRVTAHTLDEEQRLFPRLQAACPAELLRELGEKTRTDRPTAPARPRPSAPQLEPAHQPETPATGILGRIRGFLTARGRHADG